MEHPKAITGINCLIQQHMQASNGLFCIFYGLFLYCSVSSERSLCMFRYISTGVHASPPAQISLNLGSPFLNCGFGASISFQSYSSAMRCGLRSLVAALLSDVFALCCHQLFELPIMTWMKQ